MAQSMVLSSPMLMAGCSTQIRPTGRWSTQSIQTISGRLSAHLSAIRTFPRRFTVCYGRRATVGVIAPGSYHFGTEAPERMTVISGELAVKPDGGTDWLPYPAGTAFEIAGHAGFDVRAKTPTAYLCEFL